MSQIGPSLPPGWNDDEPTSSPESSPASSPKTLVIGPTLPPDLKIPLSRNSEGDNDDESVAKEDAAEEASSSCYGPALPPDLMSAEAEEGGGGSANAAQTHGSEVGPVPIDCELSVLEEYQARIADFDRRQALKAAGGRREEWMTELPDKLVDYGLGARSFRKRPAEELSAADRADWTDSPTDKLLKAKSDESKAEDDSAMLKSKAMVSRDAELEAKAVELNKSRGDSLMTKHQKKLKMDKEEAEKEGGSTRVPFDRERDLKIAALQKGLGGKEGLAQRAAQLSSKFGHGQTQKFL